MTHFQSCGRCRVMLCDGKEMQDEEQPRKMLTVQAELELELERGRVEGAGLGPDPGQRKEIAAHDG